MIRSPAIDTFAPTGTISVQIAAVFVDDADAIDAGQATQTISRGPVQTPKVKPILRIIDNTD